ncbi:MAG: hypothetical protein AAGK23_00955 [Pseudomonadota bacterium]
MFDVTLAVFALYVGAVVSIDVAGLILSQYSNYGLPKGHRNHLNGWVESLHHAFWHAGLFFAYIVIIQMGTVGLPYIIVALVEWVKLLLPDLNINVNADDLAEAFTLIFGLIAIVIVILTYVGKIAEDHSEKLKGDPEEIEFDRFDLAAFYSVTKSIDGTFHKAARDSGSLKWKRSLQSHGLAASVAVDMLAVSALIKFTLEEEYGTPYIGGATETLSQWLSQLFIAVFRPEYVQFTIIVFLVVLTLAFGATRVSRFIFKRSKDAIKNGEISEKGQSRLINLLIGLRILEPFLIMIFVMRLFLDLSFDIKLENTIFSHAFELHPIVILSSIFMTLGIRQLAGPARIRKAVENGVTRQILPEIEHAEDEPGE